MIKLVFLCVVLLSLTKGAKAVVIHTDIADTGIFGFAQDEFFDIDINQDNTVDFRLRSSFGTSGFVVLPQGENSVFSTPILSLIHI